MDSSISLSKLEPGIAYHHHASESVISISIIRENRFSIHAFRSLTHMCVIRHKMCVKKDKLQQE